MYQKKKKKVWGGIFRVKTKRFLENENMRSETKNSIDELGDKIEKTSQKNVAERQRSRK